ncbi:hypothetical protein GWI33_016023 [Rhynchophorus ferrugineus]|uniref:Odorant receptor n=1 Tax=Rhynchophorus ferrugineus TaxID=354439 RepID=A0A834M5E1_RHYFE|nr:hypothetical protein GWI33_016023 [Rhynchophorus ferrugineus]
MKPVKYRELFKTDIFALKLSGLWIDIDKKRPIWHYPYAFVILGLFIYPVNLLSLINWVSTSTDVKMFASMCYLVMECHMAQYKSIIIMSNREECNKIFAMMDNDYLQPRNSSELTIVNGVLDKFSVLKKWMSFIRLQFDLLAFRSQHLENFTTHQIRQIVWNHHQILELFGLVKGVFGKIYFWQIFTTTVTFCMNMYLLSVADVKSFEFLYLFLYQTAIFLLLLFPCWFASVMTEKSENVPVALYSCNWFDASEDFKKQLVYVMMRTQTPLMMLANDFFYISVELFMKIVKTSMSYFAVLTNLDASENQLSI